MTFTISKACLQRNYSFIFYIADVNNNILGLDFLKDKDINISCRNLTVIDNLTKFTSTRNNSPAPLSHNPVTTVSLDVSQITETAVRSTMERNFIFNFWRRRFSAKLSYDEMQRLGIIRPSKYP